MSLMLFLNCSLLSSVLNMFTATSWGTLGLAACWWSKIKIRYSICISNAMRGRYSIRALPG